MKSSSVLLIATVAFGLALPLESFAAKADRSERQNKKNDSAATTFETMDKDKDGAVTQAEYLAVMKTSLGEDAAKTRFATLDKNGDGKLSKDEFGSSTPEKKKRKKKNAN